MCESEKLFKIETVKRVKEKVFIQPFCLCRFKIRKIPNHNLFLPSSAQAPAKFSWAELALILFPPAPARQPARPPGIVVK